jgi:hypothetical protein
MVEIFVAAVLLVLSRHVLVRKTVRPSACFLAVVHAVLVIGAVLVAAMPGPAAAQVILLDTTKAPKQSAPICGAIVNGKELPACGGTWAKYEGAAVADCRPGAFFDVGKWECWRCPPGYYRTAVAVTEPRACARKNPEARGAFGPASFRGTRCPAGSFFDRARGGECWKCPTGFSRSAALIDASNACFVPASEQFRYANRHNPAAGLSCPSGQFWDGVDGHCWSCPAGYARTGTHIHDAKACRQVIAEKQSRATRVGLAKCESGEFHDDRIPGVQNPDTGGGCWKCPAEWDRTTFPVDGPAACEKDGGLEFFKASLDSPVSCPAEQMFDFIGVNDQELRNLKGANLASASAKPAASGTCWSCPTNYKRTTSHVKAGNACASPSMEWYTAPYNEPGLFGVEGAEAAILELVRDRQAVEVAIQALADDTKTPVAQLRKSLWEEIANEPEKSATLMAITQAALLAAIEDPQRATSAQKALVAGFSKYMIARRTYIAQDALNAYDTWARSEQLRRTGSRAQQSGLFAVLDTGIAPPDFYDVIHAGVFVGLGTGLGVSAGYAAAVTNPAIYKKIFPYSRKIVKAAIKKAQMTAEHSTGKVAEKVIEKGLQASSKAIQRVASVMKAMGSLGPQLIITIAIEIVSQQFEKLIAIEEARPKLLTLLADAKQPPQLARMIDSDSGYGMLVGFWGLAVSGSARPSTAAIAELKAISTNALGTGPTTNVQAAPTVINLGDQPVTSIPKPTDTQTANLPVAGWDQIPGRAHDIAVATDGTVWVIGDNKVPGGRGIYFRGPKDRDWGSVPGGAVRIAVAGDAPWLVNDGGIAFERTGTTWANRPVLASGKIMKAVDIGASAKGVWAVAEPVKQGSYAVYRWTGKQWQRDQSAWGTRITVDRDGNPWLTNADGQIFALVNGKWQLFKGTAQDIAVDAFGAPVVVDRKGKVQVFNAAANNWFATGRDGTAVAMGAGKIWHLGPGTEVYRQK